MNHELRPQDEALSKGLQSEEDLQEILKLALRKSSEEPFSLRARLEMSAKELNIPAEALERAAQEYALQKEEKEENEKLKKKAQQSFISHLGTYVAVNIGLVFFDLFKDQGWDFAHWVIAAWGIGLLSHFFTVYWAKDYRSALASEDEDDEAEEGRKKRPSTS